MVINADCWVQRSLQPTAHWQILGQSAIQDLLFGRLNPVALPVFEHVQRRLCREKSERLLTENLFSPIQLLADASSTVCFFDFLRIFRATTSWSASSVREGLPFESILPLATS